ncbi:prolyl 4-hydroxylase subunit alpha-2-like, partial [Episyrphus balteatus]|uniref:prolyl 4-hydroxylase subunit alpha-2-like n=1 Tax=Episyrphus balteatus TaxID=286459 RepID=UPI0024864CF5
SLCTHSFSLEYVLQIATERQNLPSEEEFNEAADAIFRLQDTYELIPLEMSIGILNGVHYDDVSLSAIDCFSIGYRLHGNGQHEVATMWFQAALTAFNEGNSMYEVLDFDMGKILYFYAQALAKQDKLKAAIPLLDHMIQLDPSDAITIKQREMWQMEIKAKENFPEILPEVKPEDIGKRRYKWGCQGRFPERVANLHCIYNTTTDPFLKLAPLKMEQISLNPYVVLYHDVLSDFEIEVLQTMAKPNLQRATVYSESEKRSVPVSSRTSKFAWFSDNANNVTQRISQRLADMTGFGMTTSEQLQTMNYGIGGHYDTHYDFFNISMTNEVVKYVGDRIATAMFYLSDVKQGGATVFPNVELAVYPKKGACIFWHNLNTRGEGDSNTLHAACPVIVGSKWVCNKWIREKEQIFRRPCIRNQEDNAEDPEEYFKNPINTYLMMKRLSLDWEKMRNFMDYESGANVLKNIDIVKDNYTPSGQDDYEGAIEGILRLQHIYRLNTKDIAQGVLGGIKYNKILFDLLIRPIEDFKGAAEITHKLRDCFPNDIRVLELHKNFTQHQLTEKSKDIEDEHEPIPHVLNSLNSSIAYRLTCSEHLKPSPSDESYLQCGYLTETHPFLLLAPIKVEELSLDPLVVLYHDVIYDSEIEKLIEMANNKMTRATVTSQNGSVVSNVRTSQFVFFPKEADKVFQIIDERVADMTSLNMDAAEEHQLANYGIGGHYSQHYDFFPFGKRHTEDNRIATVLFYLSDVEQGGGTAFPYIKSLVKPKKGAAVFWFNLHTSGDGDARTMHGACPVLVGSKWVLNRWIKERGQEFARPCDLISDSLPSAVKF